MKVKIPAKGFQTPGGFYRAKVFDEGQYYAIEGNKILRVDPEGKTTVGEFPCGVKVLLEHTFGTYQVYDVFLEDSRFLTVTFSDYGESIQSTLKGPCPAAPQYDTIGSHLEFTGEKACISGTKVSIEKRKISGFHFPLHRDMTRINGKVYILSYTHPYSRRAVVKLLSGKKVPRTNSSPACRGGRRNYSSGTVKSGRSCPAGRRLSSGAYRSARQGNLLKTPLQKRHRRRFHTLVGTHPPRFGEPRRRAGGVHH